MDDHVARLANELRRDVYSEIQGLSENLTKLVAARGDVTANPAATITVNAGGVAVWASVTACLIMLAVTIVGGVLIAMALSNLNQQTQELRQTDQTIQAYINAGLVQPEETKK